MLFQTCFHDMQSVSVRNVSAVLHHNYNFKMYNSHSYHFFPGTAIIFTKFSFFITLLAITTIRTNTFLKEHCNCSARYSRIHWRISALNICC